MAALKCPFCQHSLLQVPLHGRVSSVCPLRHGKALAASAVRKWLVPEARIIFQQALRKERPGKRKCPRCARGMGTFHFGADLELDSCAPCGLVWFDRNEQETLPLKRAEEIEEEDHVSSVDIEYEDSLSFMEGRSPYEGVKGENGNLPIVTLLFLLAFTIATKFARAHEFEGYLFQASAPLKGNGLPALLSLFAHADKWHLVDNCLFFFLPASFLESTFGEKVLLQVFFFAGFCGMTAEVLLQQTGTSLGASGAIAGVFAALCLTQPQARHVTKDQGFLIRGMTFYTITYKIPVWMIFLGWIWSQIFGFGLQFIVRDGIGYGAHLGGALGGLIYVLVTDLKFLGPRFSGHAANPK